MKFSACERRDTRYERRTTDEVDGHFEHPASRSCASTIPKITVGFERKLSFSVAC
jgi:hypothetical protein